MAKWAQGVSTPKNPHKYVGKHKPRYRRKVGINFHDLL